MTPEQYAQRIKDTREAMSIYPELEVGEAYARYMEAKGLKAERIAHNDPAVKAARAMVLRNLMKPCTQPGCSGKMVLEGVCEGCIEGKKGYRSKWTCEECLHRELSKKLFMEWFEELNKNEQNSQQ